MTTFIVEPRRPKRSVRACIVAVAASACAAQASAESSSSALSGGTIGFVTIDLHWSLYQSANGKAECPQGLNDFGPRETFAKLYPKGGTEVETHLVRESLKFYPMDGKQQFPYPLAQGKVSYGLNLDGKIKPTDFTSPTGEEGVDNQLYRVIACIRNYRQPDGQLQLFSSRNVRNHIYNRSMIEITDAQSLENDDDVTVTMYRGLDRLLTDASGDAIQPRGTQRVDQRFGKRFMHRLKGRIVNGVLSTEAKDVIFPWTISSGVPSEYRIRGMRLSLKLDDKNAKGLMAGYVDVDSFYNTLTDWSEHHLAYGQLDAAAMYRQLRAHADGYPDQNGQMTAISSSIDIEMVQVYIQHGDPEQMLLTRAK